MRRKFVGDLIMKGCKQCGALKATDDFYSHLSTVDGVRGICKACWCERGKKWREKNKERCKEYYESQKEKDGYKKSRSETSRKYRENNPDKAKAHASVYRALISGLLVKGVCEKCGESKAEGHHDNYSKPLEVRWLCKKHHDDHHKEERSRRVSP